MDKLKSFFLTIKHRKLVITCWVFDSTWVCGMNQTHSYAIQQIQLVALQCNYIEIHAEYVQMLLNLQHIYIIYHVETVKNIFNKQTWTI